MALVLLFALFNARPWALMLPLARPETPPDLEKEMARQDELVDLGQATEAFRFTELLLASHAHRWEASFLHGRLLSRMGRHEEAIAAFRMATKLCPHGHRALLGLGASLAAGGHIQEAYETYRKALRQRPYDHETRLELCRHLMDAQRHDDALKQLYIVAKQRPGDVTVHGQIALCLFKTGRHKDAIRHVLEHVVTRSDTAYIHNLLGMSLSKLELRQSAICEFRKALRKNPSYRLARANLRMERLLMEERISPTSQSLLLQALERPESDLEGRMHLARVALEDSPDLSEARFLLANCFMERGELASAQKELERVCREDPANLGASFNLGLLHHDAGRWNQAKACFRHVLDLDPHHGRSAFRLGVLELQTKNEGEGLRLLERAAVIEPLDANVAFWLGYGHRRLGNVDRAERQLRRALGINPEHADARIHLALLLADAGRLPEARLEASNARSLGILLPEELEQRLRPVVTAKW